MNTMGITWGYTHNIWFFPLFLCAISLALYRFACLNRALAFLTTSSYRGLLLHNFSWTRQHLKLICLIVGSLCMFLALLGPQWDKKEEKVMQEGRDIFVALDISKSMMAQDCKPSRIACAKQKIKKLLQSLACERVGLILFSGSAFIQCPLTTDYAAFQMFLDHIDVETISSGSTALDKAIEQALVAFNNNERKNKLLMLVTDGEDFSTNLSGVKEQARQLGINMITLGVGTQQGAPIPLFDEHGKQKGHQSDSKGSVVISRLNETMLSSLAQESGGTYIKMSEDETDIKKIARHIQAFEKEKIGEKTIASYEEQYPYFLMVSFLCFALEWIL